MNPHVAALLDPWHRLPPCALVRLASRGMAPGGPQGDDTHCRLPGTGNEPARSTTQPLAARYDPA